MIGRAVAKKSKQRILLLRFSTAFLQQFSDEMGQKDAASGHRQIIQIEDNFGFPKIQKDKLRPYQKVKQQISAHKGGYAVEGNCRYNKKKSGAACAGF